MWWEFRTPLPGAFVGDDHLGAAVTLLRRTRPACWAAMVAHPGRPPHRPWATSVASLTVIVQLSGISYSSLIISLCSTRTTRWSLIAVRLDDVGDTGDLCNDRFTFRHAAGFEQLFHAGETGRDVATSSHTTGMEGAQGQLRARLANGLGSHDTNRRTHARPSYRGPGPCRSTWRRCRGSARRSVGADYDLVDIALVILRTMSWSSMSSRSASTSPVFGSTTRWQRSRGQTGGCPSPVRRHRRLCGSRCHPGCRSHLR